MTLREWCSYRSGYGLQENCPTKLPLNFNPVLRNGVRQSAPARVSVRTSYDDVFGSEVDEFARENLA
jgi:hypothetical protein